MKKAIIYHWWAKQDDRHSYEPKDPIEVWKNLRVPILLSIATIRAHSKNIPIYVMCCNDEPQDWGDFPKKLNFTVVQWKLGLQNHKNRLGWDYLSRLIDIQEFSKKIPEDEIIYCDCDVFWLKSPLPLDCNSERFCCNPYNTGLFYFDKTSSRVNHFFEVFKAHVTLCLIDEEFQSKMKDYVAWDYWQYMADEIITSYIFRKYPNMINEIPTTEHGFMRDVQNKNISVSDIKAFHCNGLLVNNEVTKFHSHIEHSRGLVCLLFKELYKLICSVFTKEEIEMIFTKEELDHYLPLQFEIKSDKFLEVLEKINDNSIGDLHMKEILNLMK